MKYIDAEKLKAEIERRKADAKLYDMSGGDAPMYDELLSIIEFLQKEEPGAEEKKVLAILDSPMESKWYNIDGKMTLVKRYSEAQVMRAFNIGTRARKIEY